MALTARPGLRLVLLEAEDQLAAHQTGNNSGVIHSGLYYKPGSLKARNCTAGSRALYRFCAQHDLPHERCGKVVVAVGEEELPALEALERRGCANGLEGIERITSEQIREREPHIRGIAGLWVPQTGIVDYTAVAEAFGRIVTKRGGEIRLQSRVTRVIRTSEGLVLETAQGEVQARNLVNCAGLQSDRFARLCGVDPQLQIVPFRGEYYELIPERQGLIRNLVYPVPDPRFPFLGVHFTRMVRGGVEAGPNAVLALKREGYSWDAVWRSLNKGAFVRALQRLLPELRAEDVHPAGAGVRAQALAPDGRLADDFRIVEAPRMVHVLNAPSPAATASISIGESIAALAGERFDLG
jgi:L-2-hydroxyglutarate oxidase